MELNQDVNELEQALQGLVVPVRLGDGLDAAAVERATLAVRVARARWKTRECISTSEVALLLAVYPDLEAASYLYGDSDAERIRETARQLSEEMLLAVLEP